MSIFVRFVQERVSFYLPQVKTSNIKDRIQKKKKNTKRQNQRKAIYNLNNVRSKKKLFKYDEKFPSLHSS